MEKDESSPKEQKLRFKAKRWEKKKTPARNLYSALSSTTPPYSNQDSKSLTTILASLIDFNSASSKRKGAAASDNFSNWLSSTFHICSLYYFLKYSNFFTISMNASSSIIFTPSSSAFSNLEPASSPATT